MTRDRDVWLRAVRRTGDGRYSAARDIFYNPGTRRWARTSGGVWEPRRRNDGALVDRAELDDDDARPGRYVPACDMSVAQEDQIHHLMGRVKRGTLSRRCLEDALRAAQDQLSRGSKYPSEDVRSLDRLRSAIEVYGHVLKYGEFKRNPATEPRDGSRDRSWRDDFDARWSEVERRQDRDGDWERDFDERWEELGAGLPTAANPQLQVIENPGRGTVEAPSEVLEAVELFHGSADGEKIAQFQVDDGKPGNENVYLAVLGRCPYVSWVSKAKGAKPHSIEVEGEYIKFKGFRPNFRGEGQPFLALDPKTREGVIIGGKVERLKSQCRGEPVAPAVEYIVPGEMKKKSTKAGAHYVHEFDKGSEPRLIWDEDVNGLRYSGGSYYITDWWHR